MTAVRALLMTDLVNSTGTAERLGESAASELWLAHDRLARSLLQVWNGIEIDKSDGFLLIFSDAAPAASFALAYLRALSSLPEPVQARVGLHVAPVDLRDNEAQDVERGAKRIEVQSFMAKAVTARLMMLAGPGQILLSASAAAGLDNAHFRLRHQGQWRLQGIAEPLEVCELGNSDAAFAPPPDSAKAYQVVERAGLWVPRRALRHSLLAERDEFVGRMAELRELAELLHSGHRQVSVLGAGGIGKTRFALRFGWQWLGDYPGGVWFCDLTHARSLDGLAFAVAVGLDLPLDRSEPLAQLGRALAGRGACLVILDNFEQVAEHAETTLGRWLQQAPEARFIATSREVLGIVGEQVFALAPLPAGDASTLFKLRAVAAAGAPLPDGPKDKAAIAPLVEMLDGLPLAIELAAARARVMSPQLLLARMNERFKLLAGSGQRPERQATLRATLDWSWGLLRPFERSALAQLTVFEGGFSLADTEAVLDLSGQAGQGWVPDAVQSLLEKSMLRRSKHGRFDMLHSVQEYAAAHLHDSNSFAGSGPEFRARIEVRHWHHFASLDEQAAVANEAAAAENLLIACRRASAAGDAEPAGRAFAGLWAALRLTGPYPLLLDLGQRVQALEQPDPAQRGAVERMVGSVSEILGRVDLARRCFDVALQLARDAGDEPGEARALCALGEHHYKQGQPMLARECLLRSHEIAARHGLVALQCSALNAMGTLENRLGRPDAARAAYRSALLLAQAMGDQSRVGGLLGNLAMLAHEAGAEDEAEAQYEQALALTVQLHDRRWEGNTRCNLGLLYQERGRSSDAEAQFEKALALARDIGYSMLEATVLCNLGILRDGLADHSRACEHHAQAVEVAKRLGDRRAEGQFRGYLGECQARCGRMADAFAELDAGDSALQEVGDEASRALLRCQLAITHHLCGDSVAARRALDDVRRLPGAAEPGGLRRAIDRAALAMHAR